MSQKIINTKTIKLFYNDNPNAKNEDFYLFFEANTSNLKGKIRKIKNRIDKKKVSKENSNIEATLGEKKLSAEYIENLIREGLDDNPGNIQLIGKATDFFIKVKTDKKEGTKQLLDMEGFLKLAEDKQNEA